MEKELQHSEWKGTTYGNSWMHRHLVGMLRVIPPRLIYAFAKVFVIPPTVAINTNGRRYAYSFARKRLGLGRFDAIKYVFRNFNAFAEVIIDRFAMYAGRKFDVVFLSLMKLILPPIKKQKMKIKKANYANS